MNFRNIFITVSTALLSLLTACGVGKENVPQQTAIIPRPAQMATTNGSFTFTSDTRWQVENNEQKAIAMQLASLFHQTAGFVPEVGFQQGDIVFATDTTLAAEAYRLSVAPTGIRIAASSVAGFFYATQSIRQLLPPAIDGKQSAGQQEWRIPALEIEDAPRFEYRGLMLDVSRYFIPKETVCRIIDAAAMMKINKLHMHLVDDNGWRLEIKKYPRLTEVGAWRAAREEFFPARPLQKKGEPATEGGFYTQQEMKEIIAYASERCVEVIPEIEMPAHTNSSLAAYPDLACPVVDENITVLTGIGGRNSEIIYCAGNEKVFEFLQDVIDEVAELFPSQYIHLGGDEATKTYWNKCPKCQARMRAEGLPNTEELQSYFMKRMCRYVQQKGKQPMGWDELTNSELPDDVIIYGWQGMGNAALKAARQGHPFIMTPARILYLIRYQGPQWFEPRSYFGNNTLADVYNYEPVREDWEPEIVPLLKGIQASLWTEFCRSEKDVEYQIFPRLAALAEAAWTTSDRKEWPLFLSSLDRMTVRWNEMGITSARSMYNLDHKVTPASDCLKVAISNIRPDLEIRYTLDGSEPTASSALYGDTLSIGKNTVVNAATFSNGKRMGKVLTLPLRWNKAAGKKIEAQPTADRLYCLTNGLRGSDKHSDFEWCGWYNTDFSFTVDLEKEEDIRSVSLGSVTNYGMGVHIPSRIEILGSTDNETFFPIGSLNYGKNDIFVPGIYVSDHHITNLNTKARYVKVSATNPGLCPSSHVRQESKTWVYFDEIIIE